LRLLEQHLYEQGLDGLSVRIDLGDLVAQGSQQSLRVRSALRVSALAGHKAPTSDAYKLLLLAYPNIGIDKE
jgi:hypothetical protein